MNKIGIHIDDGDGSWIRCGEANSHGEARLLAEKWTHETNREHTIDGLWYPVIPLKKKNKPEKIVALDVNEKEDGDDHFDDGYNRGAGESSGGRDYDGRRDDDGRGGNGSDDNSRSVRRGCGCIVRLIILGLLLWVLFLVFGKLKEWIQGADTEKIKSQIEEVAKNAKDQASDHLKSGEEKSAQESPDRRDPEPPKRNEKPDVTSDLIESFEGIALPQDVVVTEKFSLLDSVGKETEIPVGRIIKVIDRKKAGTLVTEINGAAFVGSESRMAGKVKLRSVEKPLNR
jgi:hypothetical protein